MPQPTISLACAQRIFDAVLRNLKGRRPFRNDLSRMASEDPSEWNAMLLEMRDEVLHEASKEVPSEPEEWESLQEED